MNESLGIVLSPIFACLWKRNVLLNRSNCVVLVFLLCFELVTSFYFCSTWFGTR